MLDPWPISIPTCNITRASTGTATTPHACSEMTAYGLLRFQNFLNSVQPNQTLDRTAAYNWTCELLQARQHFISGSANRPTHGW